MAPVHFAVLSDPVVRVPVATDPFWIGRDPGCDLCLWDLRVSRRHAKVTRVKGEHILSAEGRHGVFVNGAKVPVFTLRHGDRIVLTPPDSHAPVELRFENALEGVFLPPDVPVSTVWLSHEQSKPRHRTALGRYDLFDAGDTVKPGRTYLASDRESRRDAAVEVLEPAVRDGREGDRFLRVATALAGAVHPALARILEAGISPAPAPDTGVLRWLAVDPPTGRPASLRIAEGPQSPITVVRRLRSLAGALHLLHGRGAVHGTVLPASVLLRPDGGATITSYGRAFLAREGPLPGPAAPPDAAWAAPEVVAGRPASAPSDVFGLAALGYGMLAGQAPASGTPPRPPSALGAAVPGAVDDLLLRGLSADPSERPTAEDFMGVLAYAEASIKSGEPPP